MLITLVITGRSQTMARVESKNLFHHRPNGVPEDYVEAMATQMREGMMQKMDPAVKEVYERINSDDPTVSMVESGFLQQMRDGMDTMFQMFGDPYKEYVEKCIHSELKVPMRDGNDFEVPVLVHTPKEIAGKKANPAIIYAHGGGVVAGTAIQMKPILSHIACKLGVVYFNVDYRLAPETKCPKNVLDFYCAVKHVKENAEELGIDPSRIAIAGDSGGGYICFASMVMMAQKNETDLVKLAIPGVAMISDMCFSDPAAMPKEEREVAYLMRRNWHCLADDFEAQKNDPLLFPAKASDEIIAKMPPTIIYTMEFDLFITENTRMTARMLRMGRLLEFCVQHGMNHNSAAVSGTKGKENHLRDFTLAIQEYLL